MTKDDAKPIEMQRELFAAISRMFASETPLYDTSLLINEAVNRAVCDVLAGLYRGFRCTDTQLAKTSAERHGAIRIGTPDEYRWIARFFACFGMEPHNFYNMSGLGAKSQPVVATAFRSVTQPEHRMFTSLLLIDSFDEPIRDRLNEALAARTVFSDKAKSLVELSESRGGLCRDDAKQLIHEGIHRIFKWMGTARDHDLYVDLCASGNKIAADIACFDSHHLNHLTPNTLCMDVYTSAMKLCMGLIDASSFRAESRSAMHQLIRDTDAHTMLLLFKHLSHEDVDSFVVGAVNEADIDLQIDRLTDRCNHGDLRLKSSQHAGFKEHTEGPPSGVPVLLRQDSYKALTEPVVFRNADGTTVNATHTARFGEVEQRFYATTSKGRALYDECLQDAESVYARHAGPPSDAPDILRDRQCEAFARFPGSLDTLLRQGLVFGLYAATEKGIEFAKRGAPIGTTDIHALVRSGLARVEGIRYEDFLPFSAAGIFASNLNQKDSLTRRETVFSAPDLERVMGRNVIDTGTVYAGLEAISLLDTYSALGLLDKIDNESRRMLESNALACQAILETGCPL